MDYRSALLKRDVNWKVLHTRELIDINVCVCFFVVLVGIQAVIPCSFPTISVSRVQIFATN